MFLPRSVCNHHPSNLPLPQNSSLSHLEIPYASLQPFPRKLHSRVFVSQSILCHFRAKKNSMRSQNHEPITLTTLPPELLLIIADQLSPAHRSCLALCNHRLLEILFNSHDQLKRCFRVIVPDDPLFLDMNDTRISFLTQLSKDLPHYYLCLSQGCLKLHTWRHIKEPGRDERDTDADSNLSKLDHPGRQLLLSYLGPPSYNLDFVHLQLIMRAFHFGPEYGIPPESLDFVAVTQGKLGTSSANRKTGVVSIERRICPAFQTICCRIQRLQVVESVDYFHSALCEIPVPVCGHTTTTLRKFGSPERPPSSYNGAAADDDGAKCGTCDHCQSRFRLEYHSLDSSEVCVVLTTWRNLGSKLRPHCIPSGCEVTALVDAPVPDPRLRFEEHSLAPRPGPSSDSPAALTVEEVRSRNLGLLGVVIDKRLEHSEGSKLAK